MIHTYQIAKIKKQQFLHVKSYSQFIIFTCMTMSMYFLTLLILMLFSITFDTMSQDGPLYISRGKGFNFKNIFFSLKITFSEQTMQTLMKCGISFWSSLFANLKVPVKGLPVLKVLNRSKNSVLFCLCFNLTSDEMISKISKNCAMFYFSSNYLFFFICFRSVFCLLYVTRLSVLSHDSHCLKLPSQRKSWKKSSLLR